MYVRIYYTGGLIIWTSTFLIKRMVYGMSCREIIISLALLYHWIMLIGRPVINKVACSFLIFFLFSIA